jgi:uncharacterized membrane protein
MRAAAPVQDLRRQVEGALERVDAVRQLREQIDGVQKELGIQFQRIAQMQGQLDKLMAILTSSTEKPRNRRSTDSPGS